MRSLALQTAVLGIAGCGGKVVVDQAIGAGGQSSTDSTATATGASTGAGINCASLQNDLKMKIAAAQECAPSLRIVQCSGSKAVMNACGCPVIVNEAAPDLVEAAQAAWVACDMPQKGAVGCCRCPSRCAATGWVGGYCKPTADGSSGTCEPVYGD